MELSEDRRALIEELERLEGEARELVAGLSLEQLNWQPDGGRSWSVGQCIDHLARSNAIYLPALAAAAAGAEPADTGRKRELTPNLFGRFFLRWLEPPARLKAKAPLSEMQPASRHEPSVLVEQFARGQREVTDLVRATAAKNLNGIRFRNPMVSGKRPFNVATGLLVIAAHERRHLWQARRVLERPDFPR